MKSDEYQKLVTECKVFVDTCSLLHEGAFEIFYNQLAKYLYHFKSKVIIPLKVIEEIDKKSKDGSIDKDIIKRFMQIFKLYRDYDLVDIRAGENDPFADNLFQQVFIQHRLEHKLALITQDKSLSRDILSLNNANSVYGIKGIYVYSIIKKNGQFELASYFDKEKILMNKKNNYKSQEIIKKSNTVKKFEIKTEITKEKEIRLPVSHLPKENEVCFSTKKGEIKLVKQISSGGEGITYFTDNGLVAKVYHEKKITNIRYNKLKLMVNSNLSYKGICWPIDLLFNRNNEFVGYIMNKANGIPLQLSLFIPKLLENEFPDLTRLDLVKLSLKILDMIHYLHSNGVILGDINPLNILINRNNVYIIDTDSFQINEYPCPVGTINFTPPELQGKDFSTFLRTLEHEYFALATLLFMILLPGKPPYSQQGGGDPSLNIRNKDFSYPLGDKTNKKTPPGKWRFIWSNLPYKVKEAFYNTFKEDKRLSTSEWIKIMKQYQYDLENGYVSNELFPNNFKIVDPINVNCVKCNKPEIVAKDFYNELLNNNKNYICKECREKLYSTNKSNPRAVRLQQRKTASISTYHETKSRGLFKCFITSATIISLGKDDNCYELNKFREFRDNWLSNIEYGKYLIDEYYNIAPLIVEQIDKNQDRDAIYQFLWENYLSKCLKFIEIGEYSKTLELYMTMIKELQDYFLEGVKNERFGYT